MIEKISRLSEFNWESPKGFDEGIEQFIVENTLDEINKKGIRTRFVKFNPGAQTKVKFIHDYHEEVYLVEGDQILLNADTLSDEVVFNKGEYFVRYAGKYHGPFRSEKGCLLLEIHYY